MIRPRDEKPIHPRNGDKYRNKAGRVFEMRYGTWIDLTPDE